MKKSVIFLFLFFSSITIGQTKLVSFPLELKKSADYHQILTAVTNKNKVYAFATDKDNITVLRFNSSLFFQDSLTIKRPEKQYSILAGYSFSDTENPILIWASPDYKKIQSVEYNLENKTTSFINYEIPFTDEIIIQSFNTLNNFFLLSKSETENILKLYIFGKGKKEKTLDFSEFKFLNKNAKTSSLDEILEEFPIEMIDSNVFNPLFYAVQKTKLYIQNQKFLLSFDHNPKQTQVFEIDLQDFGIKERLFFQPPLKKNDVLANSFYHQNTLYQLIANESEMNLSIKDYATGDSLKTFFATENDSVGFKNSPFFLQNGNQQPRDLKTTKKFLRKLSTSFGLSVYKANKGNLLTIGSSKNITNTGNAIIGISLGIGVAITGNGGVFVDDIFDSQTTQSIYFESLLGKNFEHINSNPEPLAVDYISEFLTLHKEAVLEKTFRYKEYYILSYYDSKSKEFILRKFQDGL